MSDEKIPPGSKFSVPEPPPDIPTGFLTEFWNSESPLPRVTRGQRVLYYLQRGLQNVLVLPLSNAITVLTIAISLFLFSGFLLILQNVDRIVSEAGGTLSLTVYLKNSASEQGIADFIKGLEADTGTVRSVNYISKQDALVLFRKELGERSAFLEGLENDNPLPPSIDVTLQPDELGVRNVDKIIANFQKNSLVDEVVYGSKWAEKSQAIVRMLRMFGIVVLCVVLAVIVFLIANTIKLVIYSRRDEIGIMKLVGATDKLIKLPFFIGGLIQGFVGSIASLGVLLILFSFADMQLRNSAVFGVAVPQLVFLGPLAVLGVIVIGLVVGAVGSVLALGRFIDV